MHLQTIIHSVAIFGIENAAAHVSGQPRKIHSKAQFAQNEPVFRIARRMLPLTRRARPGRSCFLYRNSLPHPAKPVKHFYVILQKIIPTSQSASQTAPLIGEPLAGRASPAIRIGPIGRRHRALFSLAAVAGLRSNRDAGPATVNLGSGARPFTNTKNFARPVRPSPTRQWSSSLCRYSRHLPPAGGSLSYQGSWRAVGETERFIPRSAFPVPANRCPYRSPSSAQSACRWRGRTG